MRSIERFNGTYGFLSNFYRSEVVYEGIRYPTSEHAYQASKSMDTEEKLSIALADTPAIAKRMGKQVTMRPDWDRVKRAIMYDILKIKFEDPSLQRRLLDTREAELIEGNIWGDTYWGVCNGKGHNHLGHILMTIREELRHAI